MGRLSLAFAATVLAALLAAPGASAAPTFSPDRVIVEWAAGASPAERRAAREEADVDFERDLGSRRFQLVETEPGQTPRGAMRELETDPAVVVAERDGYYSLDSLPNDPLFGQLWGFQNTGLGIDGFTGAVAGDDINVAGAWDRTIGTPTTVVADIDSGYRFEHPDLANVAWTNPGEVPENGLDDDDDGVIDDVHGADFANADAQPPVIDGDPTDDSLFSRGHGVHTAGIIGAQGNNGIGVTGVAQNVTIMPVRACVVELCSFSALVEAVNYAGTHGARAANMSLGSEASSVALADAIAANPQTLFVISAGNEGESNEVKPKYPCVYNPLAEGRGTVDNVVCVAATDQADQRAGFSNWGVNTVDLGAPGTEILSVAPFRYVIEDDFELDDFASKWVASGTDGGLVRTNEAPLKSFGVSDSPGAAPIPGAERASTSVPVMLPAGYQSCAIELMVPRASGGTLGILLDGEEESVSIASSGRITHKLGSDLSAGGEVAVRVGYKAGPNPGPNSGLWIEEINLNCVAKVGEADGYRFAEGTSMAAPQVTGAAALLFSLKPTASVTEVRQGLLRSVDPVSSLAGKTTSGGRLDAGAATDLFYAVPPPTPSLSATSPASPSKSNQPRLIGSAQQGTNIDVYANATCSGSPVLSGTAAQLGGAGIAVTVADETTTAFAVKATDLAPHASACSAPISYTENSDFVAPVPPQLAGTDPASPSASGTPRILGAAEAGSAVKVYSGSVCAGSPLAAGSAAELASPGISVPVAEGVTAVFSATATDAAANTSACSASISYTHVHGDPPPPPPPPPPPACIVPKLNGKTLAQARAALKAATCKLGKVRKPRARKGRRLPLVVKSSTPSTGARLADGKVDLVLGPKPKRHSLRAS